MTPSACRPAARRFLPALALALHAAFAAAAQPYTAPALPLPARAGIADGSTVTLRCGATYQGTLDLTGAQGVTVRTEGDCGKATITPARPVAGWSLHAGRIWSAPVDFIPLQVALDGVPLAPAHWPDQPWARGAAVLRGRDLAGATVAWLENQSVVKAAPIAGNAIGNGKPFYVEGKLWMLDRPGEWALDGGRLYLWAPDGGTPEGRVLAAPAANGIDAGGSRAVTVAGVRVLLGADGISADHATGLRVLDTTIEYSARDGIRAGASSALLVDGCRVHGSGRNGIDGWYWITGATVANTIVSSSGMRAMPAPAEGAIMFGDGSGNHIDHVHVTDSAYHGIVVLHNLDSSVSASTIERACLRLADCGGIYTASRDRRPLGLLIEGNTIRHVQGREAVGIYLDDWANHVTVTGNTVSDSTRALLVHDGFDNTISHNSFNANDAGSAAAGALRVTRRCAAAASRPAAGARCRR